MRSISRIVPVGSGSASGSHLDQQAQIVENENETDSEAHAEIVELAYGSTPNRTYRGQACCKGCGQTAQADDARREIVHNLSKNKNHE